MKPFPDEIAPRTRTIYDLYKNDEESQRSDSSTNEDHNRKRAAINAAPMPKKKGHAIKVPPPSDK